MFWCNPLRETLYLYPHYLVGTALYHRGAVRVQSLSSTFQRTVLSTIRWRFSSQWVQSSLYHVRHHQFFCSRPFSFSCRTYERGSGPRCFSRILYIYLWQYHFIHLHLCAACSFLVVLTFRLFSLITGTYHLFMVLDLGHLLGVFLGLFNFTRLLCFQEDVYLFALIVNSTISALG